MTKLPFGTGPVIRELPVVYKGKVVIAEIYPNAVRYRLKGERKFLTQIDHLVAIEAGMKVEFLEAKR